MKRNFTGCTGVTLIEISLAIVILIVAIVPLMSLSSRDVTTAIETEKIQMAERILESIKTELMAMPFKTFYERIGEEEAQDPDKFGPYELLDGFYPISLKKVLEIQKKFKDFTVTGSWAFSKNKNKVDKTMVQVDVECSFSRAKSSKVVRKKSFLIVKP